MILRVFERERIVTRFEDVAMMSETIQSSGRHSGIAKDLHPF